MSMFAESPWQRRGWFTIDGFRESVVSLIFITSFFVKVEPALTDYLAVLAIILFFSSGLHFSRYLAPGMLFLILFLVSSVIATIPISKPVMFADDSPYGYPIGLMLTASSAVFLSGYISADPMRRFRQVERAYWIGATIGALLGLLIYLKVEPFYTGIQSIGDNRLGDFQFRIRGAYKDPNVYATWLVFPVVSMVQAFMVGRLRPGFVSVASFLTVLLALLLAFSRGAWISAAAATFLCVILTAMNSPSSKQRARIVTTALIGSGFIAFVLVALLSIPSMQAAFMDRFVLVKSYDSGEIGRFGNQLNAIPMLLRLPFGFGPYQFQEYFGLAPHNTFLNAFSAGGWMGGIAYLMLTVTNIAYGLKAIFTRSPYQSYAIVVFCSFIVLTFQGVQIDEEHWRHLYWLMGIGWGLAAVVCQTAESGYRPSEFNEGWSVPQESVPGGDVPRSVPE
jgi:hypothetical protein